MCLICIFISRPHRWFFFDDQKTIGAPYNIIFICNVKLLCWAALHCTVLYRTILYCDTLYCVLYHAVLYYFQSTVLDGTSLYCVYCTACASLYCVVCRVSLCCYVMLCCAVLHCTAPHCIPLHCSTLHGDVIYVIYSSHVIQALFQVWRTCGHSCVVNVKAITNQTFKS